MNEDVSEMSDEDLKIEYERANAVSAWLWEAAQSHEKRDIAFEEEHRKRGIGLGDSEDVMVLR